MQRSSIARTLRSLRRPRTASHAGGASPSGWRAAIEHLGDGLIVTEAGSGRVIIANPRARELIPELVPGAAADGTDSPLPPVAAALAGEALIDHRGRTLALTAARAGDGRGRRVDGA